MVVFDYFDKEIFNPDKSSLRMEKTLEFLQNIEEPMKTGFNPLTLADDLVKVRVHVQRPSAVNLI
jgi:hypothetical protein